MHWYESCQPRRSNSHYVLCMDSKFIKTLCDGGSEGVLMCIGVVCGAAGAQLTTRRILVLGFSGLVSLSIGVGINEFLAFRAQNLYLLSE